MQRRKTANCVQVIAIGFVLGQADELAIAELNEQRDVGLANGAANVAVSHECFSLRKQVCRSCFGFESFTENNASLFFLASFGAASTTKPPQQSETNVNQNAGRETNNNYFHDQYNPIQPARSNAAGLWKKTH